MSDLAEVAETIDDLHDQDWLIIFEALAEWGGDPTKLDDASPRRQRSWELIDIIADEHNMPEDEFTRQIVDDWRGPDGESDAT